MTKALEDKKIEVITAELTRIPTTTVELDEEQAKKVKALIWCPDSNFFLLNATADVQKLKSKTSILFGTDSTLTSDWNLWEHLRRARKTDMLSDSELFETLTKAPAKAWNQNNIGTIDVNKDADIVVAKYKSDKWFDGFYSLNPEDIQLILHKGKIRLFDEEIKDQLSENQFSFNEFSKIIVNRKVKYIHGNLPKLINEVLVYYPEATFPVSIDKDCKN